MRKPSRLIAIILLCCSTELIAQDPDLNIPQDTVPGKPKNSPADTDTEKYLFDGKTSRTKREVFRKYVACDVGASQLSIPAHVPQLDSVVPSSGLYAPILTVTFASQKRRHCYFSQSVVAAYFAQTSAYGESFGGDPHMPGYSQTKRTKVFSKFCFTGWAANLNLEFGKKFYWGTRLSGALGLAGFQERFWKYYQVKTISGPHYRANLTEVTSGSINGGMNLAFYAGASCYAGYFISEKFAVSFNVAANMWLLPNKQVMFRSHYYREDGWNERMDPALQVGIRYIFATLN